jgi:predicted metal-dependent RNase
VRRAGDDRESVFRYEALARRPNLDHSGLIPKLSREGYLVGAAEAGQNVIVPVFTVGRAQERLPHLGQLERDGRIPRPPVYLGF